jgi:hypothetical protein
MLYWGQILEARDTFSLEDFPNLAARKHSLVRPLGREEMRPLALRLGTQPKRSYLDFPDAATFAAV